MSVADFFSRQADRYARYRPRYPRELFAYLSELTPGDELAWDAATGNGQAAIGLSEFFRRVVATDISAGQIASATPCQRVTYCVAPAHESGLADRSVDLITVAQAAHWFDLEPFYAEVRRVAHPGGVIALWCYHLPEILPAADFILRDFEEHVLKDNWSPGARLLHEHYRAIPFPFAPIDAAGGPESRSAGSQSTPEFTSVTSWDLSELLGHLSSWSAAQRFRETRGGDPLDEVRDRLRAAWGDPEMKRPVRWPLYLRVGRVG